MTDRSSADLIREVSIYYTDKITQFGESPRGVDWNGEAGQTLRFEQLCKIIDPKRDAFSLNDLGCGYGALYDFLVKTYPMHSYLGTDVSEVMVRAAQSRNKTNSKARFIVASEPDVVADFGVASGIFNVRLSNSDSRWRDYVRTTLNVLDKTSRLGFAFNCLTSYSDNDKRRDYLYYADPCELFDWCKTRYSSQVALLHDYGLFEFTILVRKVIT